MNGAAGPATQLRKAFCKLPSSSRWRYWPALLRRALALALAKPSQRQGFSGATISIVQKHPFCRKMGVSPSKQLNNEMLARYLFCYFTIGVPSP
jgi:hypothetical protein